MRIRVVDLETTGFEPPTDGASGVCEIAWWDLVSAPPSSDLFDQSAPLTGWEIDSEAFGALLINPGHPIPPETSAIHHIVDSDVAGALTWREAWGVEEAAPFDVWAAHNAKFERQWITPELNRGKPWICTYRCALRAWPDAPAHSNQALRYWRRPDGLVRSIADRAHRAAPDAYVTAFLLRDLLDLHPVEQLIEWTEQPALLAKCRIGSWRGRRWSEIDEPSFLRWILARDFDEDTLFTAQHHLDRLREAARQAAPAGETNDEDYE